MCIHIYIFRYVHVHSEREGEPKREHTTINSDTAAPSGAAKDWGAGIGALGLRRRSSESRAAHIEGLELKTLT